MNFLAREALRIVESVVYGPVYGLLMHMIRSPEPLDPDYAWNVVKEKYPLVTWIGTNYPPGIVRPLLVAAKMRQDHVLGIAEHYDLSNEFFELWLDKAYRFYTAGDFLSPDESLETAQRRKADRFIELLQPRAGEKILDLGPGWGPMLRRIYEETGDKENLYGYTLSREQLNYNDQTDRFRVSFRDFIKTDYEPEFFDKLYSIETLEHCRPKDIPTLARKLFQTLKPGGIAVHQYSCRMAEARPAICACAHIFFPGSQASSYGHMLRTWEKAGFRVLSQEIVDYRPTLRAWFDRLVANRDRVIELVGVQAYNRYLVMCSCCTESFSRGYGQNIRIALQKPKVGSRKTDAVAELVHA